MKIRLFMDYISQPSRTVLAFCKISSIPVDIIEIRVNKLQHLSPQFQKINPLKQVPAISDAQNGLNLGESHAIISYLIRKYKLQDKWGLVNEIERAKIDQYMHYHHQNTRKCAGIIYEEVYSKLNPIQNINIPKSANIRSQVKHVLEYIEREYFKHSDYMIGCSLTTADLSAYFQIQSLIVVDYDMKPFQRIFKWVTELSKIEGIKEANKTFLKFVPKMKVLKP